MILNPQPFRALRGDELELLVKRLLESERVCCGLAPEDLQFLVAQNKGDGGIDALVRREPPLPTDFIRRRTVIQVKRTLSSSKLKAQLKTQAPALQLLRDGADYLLATADDAPAAKLEACAADLEGFLRRMLRKQVAVRVLGAGHLARWLEQHVALLPQVSHLGFRLLSFEEWESSAKAAGPWIEDSQRARIRQRLLALPPGAVFRLTGAPGVGKSRLALECLRPKKETVSFLAGYGPDVDGLLGSRGAIYGTLVIASCDPREHERIQRTHQGKTLTVITLGTERGDEHLEPLEPEFWGRLADADPNPLQRGVRSAMAIKSGGYPLLYRLLTDAAAGVAAVQIDGRLFEDTFGELERRIAGGTDRRAARALSLVTPVGFGADSADLRILSQAFDLSERELEAAADSMRRMGLMGAVGTRRYLKPPILQDWLAVRVWRERPREVLKALINAGADRAFLLRCLRLLSRGPIDLLNVLKDLLSDPRELLSAVGLEALADHIASLAWLHPHEVTDWVEQLLEAGRWHENLGLALARAAWWETTFTRAATLLSRGLVSSFSKQGAKAFVDMFGVRFGVTKAGPTSRLQVLDGLASSPEARVRQLAAIALARALGVAESRVSVLGAAPGQPALNDRWSPPTAEQEREYARALGTRLVKLLADPAAEVRDEAAKGAAWIRQLIQTGHAAVAASLIDGLLERGFDLQEARHQLDLTQDHDLERLDPDTRAEVGRLAEAIRPTTLRDRLMQLTNRVTLEPPPMEDLAAEVLSAPNAGDLLEELIRVQARFGSSLGSALGRLDTNRKLFPTLVRLATSSSSVALTSSYLLALNGQPTALELASEWIRNRELPGLCLELIVRGPNSPVAGRELERLIEGGLDVGWLGAAAPKWLSGAPPETRTRVLHAAIDGDPVAALRLARMVWWIIESAEKRAVPGDVDACLERAWIEATGKLQLENSEDDWLEVSRRLLKQGKRTLVARTCIDTIMRRRDIPHFMRGVVSEIADPFAPLGDSLEEISRTEGYVFFPAIRGLIPQHLTPQVMEWVASRPEHRARIAAQFVNDMAEGPANLGAALLEAFPDDDHLGFELFLRFSSGSSHGPESGWQADKLRRLQSLQGSKRKALAEWARRFVKQVERELEQARNVEEARAHGADEPAVSPPVKSIWDRLRERATEQDGFFTAKQAREIPCSSALLRAYVKRGRIRQVLHGIYRVNDVPPSDFEELVPVWLWSKERGTFSHTTALAIHQLSSVLPEKIHLTVPASWQFRRLRVPPNTVLHYGEVGETERAHAGPVRVTSVGRTLSDCREEGVDAQLLAEATFEAREQGRITEAGGAAADLGGL